MSIKSTLGADDVPLPVMISIPDENDFFLLSFAKTLGNCTTFLHTWLTYVGNKKRAVTYAAHADVNLGQHVGSSSPCSIFPIDVKRNDLRLFETNVLHLEPAKKFFSLSKGKLDFEVVLDITEVDDE